MVGGEQQRSESWGSEDRASRPGQRTSHSCTGMHKASDEPATAPAVPTRERLLGSLID